MIFSKYKSILFDCDGVVLNSNIIKSEGFFEATKPYGSLKAKKLLKYHIKNGGISRYVKFRYFIKEILKKKPLKKEINNLSQQYSKIIYDKLLNCEVAKGIIDLKKNSINNRWFIVSGSDQKEIRKIFKEKSISHFFNGGIYGSPDNKFEIIESNLINKKIKRPALFLGDNPIDYEVASMFNFDFIFIYEWTEYSKWKSFCLKNKIKFVKNIGKLNE